MDPRLREDDECGWRPTGADAGLGISHLVRTAAHLHSCHSREGGNPVTHPARMDPRLREDDEYGVQAARVGTLARQTRSPARARMTSVGVVKRSAPAA